MIVKIVLKKGVKNMVKKLFKTIILCSFIITLMFSSVSAASLKIGYVDISKVFDNYKKAEVENKELENASLEKQKQREKLVESIQKLREEMKIMSEEGKKKRNPDLIEKMSELRAFDREARNDLKLQRDKIMRDILEDIQEAIGTYAKKNKFDLIFYRNALVYNADHLDVTSEVIKILDSKYKKSK